MSDNVWSYFARLGVQVRMPRDPFFEEGDVLSKINQPILLTIEDVEEFLHRDFQEFNCQAPGCKASFRQLHECEQHYRSAHQYACATCRKSLPSNHLLELHIQESHDSFFAVLAERKPSYQCFLPTCDSLFWNGKERLDHAITVHSFPSDFRFDESKKVNGKKKSAAALPKLKNALKSLDRRASANGDGLELAEEGAMEVDDGSNRSLITQVVLRRDTNARRPLSLARMGERNSVCVDQPPSCVLPLPPPVGATLRGTAPDAAARQHRQEHTCDSPKRSKIPVRSNSCRVPKNISFGAGVGKGFYRPRSKDWYQSSQSVDTATDIEKSDMSELANCLPIL